MTHLTYLEDAAVGLITTPRLASALNGGLSVTGNSVAMIFPWNGVSPNRMQR